MQSGFVVAAEVFLFGMFATFLGLVCGMRECEGYVLVCGLKARFNGDRGHRQLCVLVKRAFCATENGLAAEKNIQHLKTHLGLVATCRFAF